MNITNIRTYQTKQALRKAIRFKLMSSSFESITINEICMAAPVSRTTFYLHYKDKYDLVIDYLENTLFAMNPTDIRDDLETYFLCMLNSVRADDKILRRLNAVTGTMELQRKMEALFIRQIQEYFHDKADDESCDLLWETQSLYHSYGATRLIMWWQMNHYPVSAGEMAKRLAVQMNHASSICY